MLEPTYLSSADWQSVWQTAFKILKEPEDKISFQASLTVFSGDIPELDKIYPYETYGFYFSTTNTGFFHGACLGRTYYSVSPLNDPRSFLFDVKKHFPEYGDFLEKNYKPIFRSLIPIQE